MRYGFYEDKEKELNRESKISSYSDAKEKNKFIQDRKNQCIKSDNTKGIAFGSIKGIGEESSKTTSKSIASAAASKAPSVVVQVADKVKDGFEKVVEHMKPVTQSQEEKESSGFVTGIAGATCFLLCLFIMVIPFSMAPVLALSSVVAFVSDGRTTSVDINKLSVVQESQQSIASECSNCNGEGFISVVTNESGSIAVRGESYQYNSYLTEYGCDKCGGTGSRVIYYDGVLATGNQLTEYIQEKYEYGKGVVE